MKKFLFFLKIFAIIIFNYVVDGSRLLCEKLATFICFIDRELRVVLTKVVLAILVTKEKLIYKHKDKKIIRKSIKNARKRSLEIKKSEIAYKKDYRRYKRFIWLLHKMEKPTVYPELYRGEEITETPEVVEVPESVEIPVTETEKELLDVVNTEIPVKTEDTVEILEEFNDIDKASKTTEEFDNTTKPATVSEDINKETPKVEVTTPITVATPTSTLKNKVLIAISSIICSVSAITLITIAENIMYSIDLNRAFLNIKGTRPQAEIMITIGLFIAIITITELVTIIVRLIRKKSIYQNSILSTPGKIMFFTALTSYCFIIREMLGGISETNTNVQIISKILPFLAIPFFINAAIMMMISVNTYLDKE